MSSRATISIYHPCLLLCFHIMPTLWLSLMCKDYSLHCCQSCILVGVGKNPSPTSVKNKEKLEYINEGQPSPLELAYGVKLGLNSYS